MSDAADQPGIEVQVEGAAESARLIIEAGTDPAVVTPELLERTVQDRGVEVTSETYAKLAEIALTSESRFIRCFRDATGQTPGRYVQDRRLRRAAEALVSTDQSIDEIAESCGFANRYYFTRVFSQRMGVPPARYRSNWPHYD